MKILNKKGTKDNSETKSRDDVVEIAFKILCVVGIAFILTMCLIVGAVLIYNILDNQAQLVPAGQIMNGN